MSNGGRTKYLWNTTKTKKIKTKEIREFSIVRDDTLDTYAVNVYGHFGGAVKVYESRTEGSCRDFIDMLTEETPAVEVDINDVL